MAQSLRQQVESDLEDHINKLFHGKSEADVVDLLLVILAQRIVASDDPVAARTRAKNFLEKSYRFESL
jgi:hypothetical protein